MSDQYRFFFSADERHGFIVIRPIGPMPVPLFIEQLFDRYAATEAPWSFHRVLDLRRHEERLDDDATQEIARRWNELTGSIDYHACVAIVTYDRTDTLRVQEHSRLSPKETVCHFSDYHEAVGWLHAVDRKAYLASLGHTAPAA